MVSTKQVFDIVLIGVGVYVAITYGPDIIKWAQKGITDIKNNVDQGTPAGNTPLAPTTQPQPPDLYQAPEHFPGGIAPATPYTPDSRRYQEPPSNYIPPQPYGDEGSQYGAGGQYQTTSPLGLYDPTTRKEFPIDTTGLVPAPKPPAITSPQNLNKTKSKTTAQRQQEQQHLQNTQTSEGIPVSPPHVPVSQAHPTSGPVTDTTSPTTPKAAPTDFVFKSRFPGYPVSGLKHTTSTKGTLRSRSPTQPTTSVPVGFPPITPAPCSSACAPFKNSPGTYTKCCRQHLAKQANVGYGYGDGGQLISLDSMFVTVA